MRSEPAKPIFIVGSPRSGTSILAWCLGQHPNIFPVPESNWMGEFARDLAGAHRVGAARGELSILSAMEIHAGELFATFGQSINELILRHRTDLQTKREKKAYESKIDPGWLDATSTTTGPKGRWVDGTPEYAFHICGLRKLFPGALFIHLVREVDPVVRSMLNFHRVAGDNLVASEEQAYNYWLRAVSACLEAEEAYGPQIVHRLLYSTLTKDPESAMRRLFDFVGEPYDAKCLKPLTVRINSSNVPADFKSDDPSTDRATIEKSRRLFIEIEQNMQPEQASAVALARLEATLWEPWLQAERSQQELKDQIRKLQQHHIREVDEYKSQIRELQQHHFNEIDHYKSQIAAQEAQYREAAEKYKSEIRIARKEYTATTRKLMRLLSKVEKAAARLRDSRRWKLVNFGGVMKAKLSHGEGMPGYGDLDEVVAAYSQWRASAKKGAARKSVVIDSSANAEKTSHA
jgi:hypothetical protein